MTPVHGVLLRPGEHGRLLLITRQGGSRPGTTILADRWVLDLGGPVDATRAALVLAWGEDLIDGHARLFAAVVGGSGFVDPPGATGREVDDNRSRVLKFNQDAARVKVPPCVPQGVARSYQRAVVAQKRQIGTLVLVDEAGAELPAVFCEVCGAAGKDVWGAECWRCEGRGLVVEERDRDMYGARPLEPGHNSTLFGKG